MSGQNRHAGLAKDRAIVKDRGHLVDGAAGLRVTRIQHYRSVYERQQRY